MNFKYFVLVLYSALVKGQALISLSAWKTAMDTGIDESPLERELGQTKNTNIDEEDTMYKLYLYQRVKMDFNDNTTISLHYGLDKSMFTSVTTIPFHVDVGYNHILINMNSHQCAEEENCRKLDEGKRDIRSYNDTNYGFFNATSFLGVNRIRPGEITVEKNDEIANFYSLPLRFYDNVEGLSVNVLGLGPGSPIWDYWRRIYHFPGRHVNITMCYNTDNEYVLFDSFIDREHEIMFKTEEIKGEDIQNHAYSFKAEWSLQTTEGRIGKEITVCVSNKDNLTMKLNSDIMDALKRELCKNTADCSKASDLKPNPRIDFLLTMKDAANPDKTFGTTFLLSSLYELVDDKIRWKVENLIPNDHNAECLITLEKEFLKEKYFMMSYNIDEPSTMLIGFKLMLPSDFSKFDFYTITMFILIIATIALFIVYMVLNHSLNKLIEKEEERQKAEE